MELGITLTIYIRYGSVHLLGLSQGHGHQDSNLACEESLDFQGYVTLAEATYMYYVVGYYFSVLFFIVTPFD